MWLGSWVGFSGLGVWLVDGLMCKYRGMSLLSGIALQDHRLSINLVIGKRTIFDFDMVLTNGKN